MYKQILPVAAMATILLGAASCKSNGGFKKTKDGVEYNIVKDEPGTPAKIGDIIQCHYIIKVGDSVMIDSRKMNNGEPLEMPLQQNPGANKAADPTEVFTMLSAGDSVVIRTEIDSMARKQLTFAKPEDKIEFQFKMVSVKTKEQYEADLKAKSAAQTETDDKILTEYFAKNGITAQKTANGLYYVVTKPGTGANAEAGKTVKVNYTGKTIDGTVFDSNLDPQFQHVEPLEFTLGQRQVIAGWDEGLALLNKGAKATLYIPSPLAYGAQSPNPKIPANGILIFDVELLDIK